MMLDQNGEMHQIEEKGKKTICTPTADDSTVSPSSSTVHPRLASIDNSNNCETISITTKRCPCNSNTTRGDSCCVLKSIARQDDSGISSPNTTDDGRIINGKKNNNLDDVVENKSCVKERWIILILSCIVMHGLYYLIALPASIHQQLKEIMPREDFEAKFQLLFTFAHFPGIVLPLFTGILIDKYGGRVSLLILSTICLLGQVITSIGIEIKSWLISLVGRFIYGLGFEPLFITNQTFLSTWFKDKTELGLALGISSAMSYVGFLLSFAISPLAANTVNASFAFWIGTILKAIAVLSAAVIFIVDKAATKQQQIIPLSECKNKQSSFSHHHDVACIDGMQVDVEAGAQSSRKEGCDPTNEGRKESDGQSRTQASDFRLPFWLLCCSCALVYSASRGFINVASGLMLERNLFVEPPKDCTLRYPNQCTSGYIVAAASEQNPSTDKKNRTCPEDVSHLSYSPVRPDSLNVTSEGLRLPPASPWDMTSYVYDPLKKSDINCDDAFFAEACLQDYCDKQDTATEKAGLLMTVPYLVTIATTFIFGHYGVDKFGWRAEMVCFAPVLQLISHGVLAFQRKSLVLPLIIHGLGYSMSVSVLWPSVPLTVKEHVLGTAFGLMTCIQNMGLAFTPLIVASTYNNAGHKYLPQVQIIFVVLSGGAILVGIGLIYFDRKSGGLLQLRKQR